MDTPSAEQLLKKIKELEAEITYLRDELARRQGGSAGSYSGYKSGYGVQISPYVSLTDHDETATATRKMGLSSFKHSSPSQRESSSSDPPSSRREIGRTTTVPCTNKQYLNMLQSMGQSVNIFDSKGRIIYWNKMAEQLYGYSASEVLGQYLDLVIAVEIINKNSMVEKWTGQFPVKNKLGQKFTVTGTNTPLYDDVGNFVGIICVATDSQFFLSSEQEEPPNPPTSTTKPDCSKSASRIINKVWSKVRTSKNNVEHGSWRGHGLFFGQGLSETVVSDQRKHATSTGDIPASAAAGRWKKYPGKTFVDSGNQGEGKIMIDKNFSSREEVCIRKDGVPWPLKESEHDGSIVRTTHGVGPCLIHGQKYEFSRQKSSDTNAISETKVKESNRFGFDKSGSSSSSCRVSNKSSESSSGSISGIVIPEADFLDYDILWEDLTLGERIGEGSCGSVYHGRWCGSDVALKVFSKLENSDDLLYTFRQEVSLMKRLRHPNVLLFMGAVTSPQQLCIVTEFLPRGSLFQLIHRKTTRLDWRRCVLMALDIARGMNYLHHCNPPIVHSDLKSSNLLVDENLTVKVADFGLSRPKYRTYLTTRSWKGTPQWMAPEILRNEPSDEKSDVYSFGVVLWELATQKIPWDNLNPMQVIGAVGFMDERIEIPKEMDPRWVSIIESCWHSEPKCRSTFQELIVTLKDLRRQYSIQAKATRLGQGDNITTLAAQI